jgi:hypothetical protein
VTIVITMAMIVVVSPLLLVGVSGMDIRTNERW